MNITVYEYNALKKAIELLPKENVPEEHKVTISLADAVLEKLDNKRLADNVRISKYVAKKRKKNPNYAR